ncbi:unnamed protein product, partial [Brassica oleracea var. botrytis]
CLSLFQINCLYLETEPLPQFEYMSCLCVSLHATSSIWLKTFLRSCPNLRYLIISMLRLCLNPHLIYLPFLDQTKMISEEMSFPFVPQCVLSSLEYVDFKVRILGLTAEMKLIRYFIENSAFLKRLTLRLVGNSARDNYTLKELLRIPRGSTNCEVVIL